MKKIRLTQSDFDNVVDMLDGSLTNEYSKKITLDNNIEYVTHFQRNATYFNKPFKIATEELIIHQKNYHTDGTAVFSIRKSVFENHATIYTTKDEIFFANSTIWDVVDLVINAFTNVEKINLMLININSRYINLLIHPSTREKRLNAMKWKI